MTTRQAKDYAIMLLLLFVSGNPVFSGKITHLLAFVFLFVFVKLGHWFNDKRFIPFLGLFAAIFVIQKFSLHKISILGDFNFMAKFMIAFMVCKELSGRFRYVYFKVMTFLAAISLVGFAVYVLTGFYIDLITIGQNHTWVLYGIRIETSKDYLRNCGAFWEPGAYAGYLCVGFAMFLDNLGNLWRTQKRSFIICVLTLVSTLSTTGYVIFFMIMAWSLVLRGGRHWVKVVSFPACIVLALLAFRLDFIGGKITTQVENAAQYDATSGEVYWDRFGSMVFDWYYIKKHPIAGNGFIFETRYSDHLYLDEEDMGGFGNGFTGIMHSMGVLFMLFYLWKIYEFCPFNKWDRIAYILIFIMALNCEQFMNYPLFLGYPFLLDKIKVRE